MLRYTWIILLFLTQVSQGQRVANLTYEGVEKTKSTFLEQFIQVRKGTVLDSTLLDADVKRLVNLEMFADVKYKVVPRGEDVEIVYHFYELKTLLPIFSFGGIRENFWIQAGVTESNLGGLGAKLIGYYQHYDRSSLSVNFRNSRVNQSRWGVGFDLIKWSTLEPVHFEGVGVDYEYDNYTVGIVGLYNFNFRKKIEFGTSFFVEEYTRVSEYQEAPKHVVEEKLLGKVSYSANKLDYWFYYLSGWKNQLNFQTVVTLDEVPIFNIFFNDLCYFKRYGHRGNIASRLRLGLSTNNESPFAPFILDSYLNIRGIGNRVDRGTGAVILNLENRYAVIDKSVFAVQGVLFSDIGSWRNPGGEFSDFTARENFVVFAGGGLRFIHKKIYNAIFRIDYGFNIQNVNSNGFVLGVGQYF